MKKKKGNFTTLLLILVLATNALISYCQEGGRRGKKKGVE